MENNNENINLGNCFHHIVSKYPDQKAVVYLNEELTYQDLNQRANNVARFFEESGVESGDRIGILFNNSLEYVISIIALTKIGASYIPLSYKENEQYLESLTHSAGIKFVFSDSDLNIPGIKILKTSLELQPSRVNYEGNPINESDIAYIMFTSGTTGIPKGVKVTHGNIINLTTGNACLELSNKNIILQTGAPTFDASTFEIWGALLNGGKLIIPDFYKVTNFNYLNELIRKYQVNMMWLTAPLFSIAAEKNIELFTDLKELIVGGDIVHPKDVNKVLVSNPDIIIYNGYGPTECTTFSTIYKIDAVTHEDYIPIGKPIKNATVYILDENLAIVEPDGVGELYIGGKGVSAGYIGNENVTEEKFITNPYGVGKLYKTGDLAAIDNAGNVIFKGRKDRQIKIRGFRIEMNAVENILNGINGIQSSAVTVIENGNGEKGLACCVVTQNKFDLSEEEIRIQFKKVAPSHIVLAQVCVVESLPMNSNGKLDYKKIQSLLDEQASNVDLSKEHEFDEQENRIIKIIEKSMNCIVKDTSISFFEIGLDSLTSIYISDEINKEFKIDIEPMDLLMSPSIDDLIHIVLDKEKIEIANVILLSSQEKNLKLLNQQEAIFIDFTINPNTTRYNIPLLLKLPEMIDFDLLKQSLNRLVDRHDSLRAQFVFREGQAFQTIQENYSSKVKESFAQVNLDQLISPFDLQNDFPYKFEIIRNDEGSWLFMDFHHIVVDGFSLKNIVQDLNSIYLNEELSVLPLNYSTLIEESRSEFYKNKDSAEKFWQAHFQNYKGMNQLPFDSLDVDGISNRNSLIDFSLGTNRTALLKEWSLNNKMTIFEALAIGYSQFLHLITGSEDVTFATPSREYSKVSSIPAVSMLTNTLWILSKSSTVTNEYLKEFVSQLRESQRNQNVPVEFIYKLKRKTGDTNLHETLIAYHDKESIEINFLGDDILIKPLIPHEGMFSLNMQIYDRDDSLEIEWEYLDDLFEYETMKSLAELFKETLDSMISEKYKYSISR
ncbi:non-ribosomal peptide synthetase [Paenibacillus sp. GCM10012307]|uniref:Amino acid adenylation domain-containing protein n=1 Tax=Paenibacillus roseus TaxID=2798579 RepID=A0A934J3Y0_9BACL|nr:non-ribosomal peptide synthetase [Paenibacillus roseus]MBJ6362385.1 amino acid adenylation domain-containing protein [Paenibacillus roseus]